MKIYTKTGDKGLTSLGSGKRVSKSDLRVESYGTIDELNATVGLAIAEIQNYNLKFKNELSNIQNDLFEIGANLANPKQKNTQKTNQYLEKRVGQFESQIDEMSKELPELTHFILPGGGKTGANLHLARTICRRCERRIVELAKYEPVDDQIIIYLNRFSDLLFILARFANLKEKKKELIWSGE